MSAPRLLTVLFTDLVASTETVARLGPEAGQAWRLGHLELLRETLVGSGGREVQAFGDGLLVVFEAASAAVACAAAMQQRVARANARRDALAETSVRVGIALGEATEDEQGVHGLVVVEAARLCAAAKGGQILASALVETLSAGRVRQRFTPLGALELKGLPAAVATVEVEWREASAAAPIPFPPALAEATRLSFVGRSSERAKLLALWQRVQAGERSLALIAGEPGIGKTRLAAELARVAAEAGAIVLFGRSDEDLSAPFQPFAQALGHYAGAAETETLRAEAGVGASDLARLVPELASRLGVAPSAPSSAEPEADRARLFGAIDELLANAARGAPVLVVLDDLHWADKPSLVLLRALMRSVRPAALLLVGTYRETDLARTHPLAELLADLRREPRVVRVLLRGLAAEDVSALVASRGQQEPPADFVAALHAETDGNPFFVEEVLRHLIETGALRRQEDGRWTSDRPIEELGIPEGVREVVGRRLSRLSETANQALGVAAVVGREFDAALIEAAGGPSGDALLDALDEAARARLIAEAPGALGRFAFAHALVRQTLYEELGTTRRVRLHWRIGEALEARSASAPEAQLSAIAHHLCQGALAGDAQRAVEVTLRAAARAEELAALEEAIALATRALALLDQARLDAPEARYRAWMLRGRAELRLTTAGYATSFAAAEQLAERLGRPEWWARAVLESSAVDADEAADDRARARLAKALAALPPGDGSLRCQLLARMALSLVRSPDECEPFADEALAMARRLGAADELESALNAKVAALIGSARVDELAAVEQELRGLVRRLSSAVSRSPALLITMLRADRPGFALAQAEFERQLHAERALHAFGPLHFWTAADALAQGRFAEARVASARARESILGVGMGALGFAAQVTAARLEEGRLAQHLPGVEQFAASAPLSFGEAYRCVAVAMRAALGDGESAARELEALVSGEFALRQRRRGGWPLALRHLCEAAALLGHEAAARVLEPEVADYSGLLFVTFSGTTIEGAADRALGQLLAVQGRLDEACSHYERALALEEGFEAWALAARTRYWWARALAERGGSGDVAQARELLGACLGKTRAFGMAHLTEQAEALRARLG